MTRFTRKINVRITIDQRLTLEKYGNMSEVVRMLLDRLLTERRKPLVKELLEEAREIEAAAT